MASSLSSATLVPANSVRLLLPSRRPPPAHVRVLPSYSHMAGRGRRAVVAMSSPTPPGISEKVSESIKNAEEACADDPVSGECAAAWDEVEELSAAASHARDKLKGSDPLENYCKDNPEADECRTYED
ncbi:calvin cycle protein CP12-1, chloroplastic [Typha angustifolia]|uniref:calvin cycle protein CP12-1, chloroplastic n=1 Tax=Typha angustifolia TaxID=59011 RepID=UPI003C2E66A1